MIKYTLLLYILTSVLSADFVRNNDQTVTDNKTGLIWQDDADAKKMKTWQGAINYCENLTLAGYSDWRLPNYNELESIVDYNRYNPAIDSAFHNVTYNAYWSSTTHKDSTDYAWGLAFDDGMDHMFDKSTTFYVRCVRSADN